MNDTILACPGCGQKNRIPSNANVPALHPDAPTSVRCGKCKRVFLAREVLAALWEKISGSKPFWER